MPLTTFLQRFGPAMEEAAIEQIDLQFLERVLPTCIKITKLIDHCIHKLSYTNAYLGDVYHDMKMLKEKLIVEMTDVSMGEDFSDVTARIDIELLNDDFIKISALLNPARGCRVVKRSADGETVFNYFMPPVETTLPLVQKIYDKYKNSVPNEPKPVLITDVPVLPQDPEITSIVNVVVPQSEMAVLLSTTATNASVAMFSEAVQGTCH